MHNIIQLCTDGNIRALRKYVDALDPDTTYYDDLYMFQYACHFGLTLLTKVLLEDERCNPNITDSSGYNGFHYACYHGRTDVVKLLLEDGRCDPNKNDSCEAPICLAIKNDQNDIVKILMEDERIDVNQSAIFDSACEYGNLEIVKMCLEDSRIDVNFKSDDSTGFTIACSNGNIEVVKLLLEDERIDPNISDGSNQTGFWCACCNESDNIDTVKILLQDPRIDINKVCGGYCHRSTAFYNACERGDLDVIKLLVGDDRLDPHIKGTTIYDTEETPLYIACKNNHEKCVKFMLSNIDNLIIPDKDDNISLRIEKILQKYRDGDMDNEESDEENSEESDEDNEQSIGDSEESEESDEDDSE